MEISKVHKGYQITVKELKNSVHFCVQRVSDGLLVVDGFLEEETLNDCMFFMKERVDEFILSKGGSEFMEDKY